jgi:hypothetical protein
MDANLEGNYLEHGSKSSGIGTKSSRIWKEIRSSNIEANQPRPWEIMNLICWKKYGI